MGATGTHWRIQSCHLPRKPQSQADDVSTLIFSSSFAIPYFPKKSVPRTSIKRSLDEGGKITRTTPPLQAL